MSEVKHTPGPWRADQSAIDDGNALLQLIETDIVMDGTMSGRLVLLATIYKDDPNYLGDKSDRPTGVDGQQAKANSQLIAAAPEMFEALQIVRHRLEYLTALWGNEGITKNVMDAVSSAINKATGATSL